MINTIANILGFGGNNCLWILILLLIVCGTQSGILSGILNSCYLPLILAFAYCACKKGGICNVFSLGKDNCC